jgi:hypothetical protein
MSDELLGMLGNLDESMKRVEVNDKGGFAIPDNEYVMLINTAEIKKAQSSDRIHIQLDCVILDGEYQGMPVRSYDLRFTDAQGQPDMRSMGYFKLACRRLGLGQPSGMEEARDAVGLMPLRVFIGRVKNSGDFMNLTVVRLIHESHPAWIASGSPVDSPVGTDKRNTGW